MRSLRGSIALVGLMGSCTMKVAPFPCPAAMAIKCQK